MDLTKLFEAQQKLDAHIEKEKGLQGVDLLDKKILALQVELGELANEWRGFKFWSENQEPNDFAPNPDDECEKCNGKPILIKNNQIVGQCDYCDGCGVHFYNPMLEEYVDVLHFILSIGNDLGCDDKEPYLVKIKDPIETFSSVYFNITKISIKNDNINYSRFYFAELLSRFFGLGKSLDFTWEQIEQAYYDKNKINHERQESGY